MKKYAMYSAFILLTVLILINAQDCIEYAKNGLNICYEIIIPSLFPFFVCSNLLIYSGFAQSISKLFTPVMLPLFRINGSGSAAFVLGLISGYPLGASTACSLYENHYLSKGETERLLAFCNNSGPLFILGAVGISLYNNIYSGIILYVSHILAAFTVGIIFRFYKRKNYIAPKYSLSQPKFKTGEIFSVSLQNSVTSILNVCGSVIFFGTVANILINIMPVQNLYTLFLSGIIEFTTGVVGISHINTSIASKLVMSAFIVGFAGLSVHFQVISIVSKYELSLKPYIIGKILHAAISSLYVFAAVHFIPSAVSTFSFCEKSINMSGSFAVSTICVCIGIIFVCVAGIPMCIVKKENKGLR